MKKRIDYFLICILWLLAVTLGTCFWFNIKFGFNILSVSHWEYLAALQATQVQIQPMFYISLVGVFVITFSGLYVLLAPRRRYIHMAASPVSRSAIGMAGKEAEKENIKKDKEPIIKKNEIDNSVSTRAPSAALRPPRPNVGMMVHNNVNVQHNIAPQPMPVLSTTRKNVIRTYPEIETVFKNAGYIVKKSPVIAGVSPFVAIGQDEVFWLGAVDTDTETVKKIADKFQNIFIDTLEDVQININCFVVASTDFGNHAPDVLVFNTFDELSSYIGEHKNTITEDTENLDAYSQYIDTVLNYIGKI